MSVNGVGYVIAVVLALGFAFRSGFVYNRILTAREGTGLLGFDRTATESYARDPVRAFRESVLTRLWNLVARRQKDPDVERARRTYVASLLLALVVVFGGLALF